jgi:hypothetical protein
MHNSGASYRGNMKLYLTVIVRLDRTIQYTRALVMEAKSCGVLDTPLSRSMTAYYGAAQCVAVASRSHRRVLLASLCKNILRRAP